MRLAGKTAVVSGGSRGIGRAIAQSLGLAGARIILIARQVESLHRAQAELIGDGISCSTIACDLADLDSLRKLESDLADASGQIDILVHNAGEAQSAPVDRIATQDWNLAFDVHCRAVMSLTRTALPLLRQCRERGGRGKIVAINSVAGLRASKYLATYCAAKHAQLGYMKVLALELEGSDIDVHTLCPGFVDTEIAQQAISRQATKAKISVDEAARLILATTGQTRLLQSAEIATEVTALCLSHDPQLHGMIRELIP